MINKENIESILKKINSDYFSITFTDNSNSKNKFVKNNIDEPILSTSFTNEINNMFPKYKCFSEFVILNRFKVDFKDLNISKRDKQVLKNKKWELDSLICDGQICQLLEFKYNKYTLSDLLRLIIMMLKIKEINAIYIIYYKSIKLLKENEVNINFVELNISDNTFNETLKFLNDEMDNFNIQNTLKNKLNKKIQLNETFNWVCIKINKNATYINNSYQEISNKENFKKLETFTNLTNKNVSLIQGKINLDDIESVFLENSFEYFGSNNSNNYKNWASLFRSNVLVNFFKNKTSDSTYNCSLAKWLVNFVENEIYQNQNYTNIPNINELLCIKKIVLNNDYEKINKKILDYHFRWSNLLRTNKEIKQKNKINDSNDNTIVTIQQNRATKVIKQVIFKFVERNGFDMNEEFEKLFEQKNVDVKKITKNYKNLNDLATKSIFILYFFAKLNIYNNKLLDQLEDKEKVNQSIDFFSLIRNKKEIKTINYSFYFNLFTKNKTTNIYESLIVDAICKEANHY